MLQAPGWTPGLRGELLGRDAVPTLVAAWEDLCGRSAEDNVYYSPQYARALLETTERTTKVRFAVVWDGPRLVAILPITRPAIPIPLLRPAGRAWQTKYTFGCMPLLDEHCKTEAAQVLLEVLASITRGEWIIPTVNTEGECCRAMISALARKGLAWGFSGHFERATLVRGGTFDEHMQRHVSAKRRKDLARNRRRLEGLGTVGHEIHRSGEGLDRAVAAFLAIEAGGWKGKRGTALACRETTRKFAETAFTGDESNSICRADVLTLNENPIAVSIITFAGQTGFAVKCAYDEAYRHCSTGLLLEVEVIRRFLSGRWADRLDSGTTGTHVILDSLWPGRIGVADLIFSLSPRFSELRVAAFRRSEESRRGIRAGLRGGLSRITQSCDAVNIALRSTVQPSQGQR